MKIYKLAQSKPNFFKPIFKAKSKFFFAITIKKKILTKFEPPYCKWPRVDDNVFFLAPTTTARDVDDKITTPTPEPDKCVCEPDPRKFDSDVFTITCEEDENNKLTVGSVCTYKCKNSKTFLIVL